MNIKIQLTTKSPLISASGESSAHIDADVKYDEYGFPYIQARTFKGVLRESAIEVTEIMGEDADKIAFLFGDEGNKPGLLQFNNLYINDYENITNELAANPDYLRPSFVKDHYTEYRRQTTIENEDENRKGTAKDKSLRTYRLISENKTFETIIENVPIEDKEDVAFLENMLANLRYMGSRRNRGFGKIQIQISKESRDKLAHFRNIEEKKAKEQPADKLEEVKDNTQAEEIEKKEVTHCLTFSIRTLGNLLISKVIGEQNTVNTDHFIPSQSIRGLIASLIIKKNGLEVNAHKNADFKKFVLMNNVQYHNAYFEGTQPVPRILGYDKTEPDDITVYDVVENAKKEKPKTLKSYSGFVSFAKEGEGNILAKKDVKTSFSFHSSRHKDRLAGRSTEGNGAIFYYEAIEKGQKFVGEIWGLEADLEIIQALLSQNAGEHRMGKSKTAQYSKVRFSDFHIKELPPVSASKIMYLVFQSPVITYNKYGMAIPNMSLLENELQGLDIESIEKMSALTLCESYMGIWHCKTPREAAFDIGTTLKITFNSNVSAKSLQKVENEGLGERKAEGYGRVKWVKELETEMTKKLPKDSGKINKPIPTNQEIHLIRKKQEAQDDLNEILAQAVTAASEAKARGISNSLISRLREKLDAVAEIEAWQKFITEIKGKKAGANLDNANLYDKVLGLKSPEECNGNFKLQKQYWLTYFKTLRAKSNLKERNGK